MTEEVRSACPPGVELRTANGDPCNCNKDSGVLNCGVGSTLYGQPDDGAQVKSQESLTRKNVLSRSILYSPSARGALLLHSHGHFSPRTFAPPFVRARTQECGRVVNDVYIPSNVTTPEIQLMLGCHGKPDKCGPACGAAC